MVNVIINEFGFDFVREGFRFRFCGGNVAKGFIQIRNEVRGEIDL